MSMTIEAPLLTQEQLFSDLEEQFSEGRVEDSTLAMDGLVLTGVLGRARTAAATLVEQKAAGISDVNAEAAAFQSAV